MISDVVYLITARPEMAAGWRPLFTLWHKHLGMWRYYHKFLEPASLVWLTALIGVGIVTRFLLLAPLAFLSRARPAA